MSDLRKEIEEAITWTRSTEQAVPPGCKFTVEITRHGETETLVYPTLQAAVAAATAVYDEVCRSTEQGADALKGLGIEAHPPTQRLARPRLTPDEIVLADNQIAALRAGIQNGLYSMRETMNRGVALAEEMLPRTLDEIDALKAELAEARAELAGRIAEKDKHQIWMQENSRRCVCGAMVVVERCVHCHGLGEVDDDGNK